MASRSLNVVIAGDARPLKKAFASAEMSADAFAGKVEHAGGRATRALGMFAKSGALAAGIGFGSILKAGVQYEKQMARVKGVTDATGEQMKQLGALAKQLGADTKFSASEAADAMYELGSAGFKVNDMAKVLPGTLSLAAASGIELADAAEISSNALNGFGLTADKMGHVADVLAQTTNRTSVEMKDLQLSMKYIGPIAKTTGQSFEDMLAAVGEMGNVGIKGEQAGTTLRGALIRLTNPTKSVRAGFQMLNLSAQDVIGPKGLKPLPELIAAIEDKTKGMDKATRNSALANIFGTEALSGMAALIDQGSDALNANADANRNSAGAAKKAADIMNDTVAGSWEQFTGSVETASISLYEKFQPALKDTLKWATDAVNGIAKVPAKLADAFGKMRDEKGSAGAAIGAMIVAGVDGIDWRALGEKVSAGFNSALKIGGKVGTAILEAFQQVPWSKVGDAIGAGLEGSLDFADTLPDKISAGISQAVGKVNGRMVLGKLVDILGEAIDSLFSPSFWYDHWKGIFATVTLVIPFAKILKVPGANVLFRFISKPVFEAIGFLGRGMASLLSTAAREAGVSFLAGIEKFAPKTANAMLDVVTFGVRGISSLPKRLVAIAGDAITAVAKTLGSGTGTVAAKFFEWMAQGAKQLVRGVGDLVVESGKIGKAVSAAILTGLGSLGHLLLSKVKDAVGWAADKAKGVGSSIGKALNPFGDGIGRPSLGSGVLPSGGAFGGSLKGANSSMKPFAAIGSRYGLSVSSGRRPGSITSSGNVSYHSSGEAVDMADGRGPDANKLAYFRYMKSHFGGQLAELIYTPGGAGVKDGQPYTYGGQVAADHYDHVHVAFDTGRPGVGDGTGKNYSHAQLEQLWLRAGGSAAHEDSAAAIAQAESGGNAGASNRNSDGSIDRGLWQINSVHGSLSTFDPMANARAAVKISHNGSTFQPWVTFKNGAYRKFLGPGSSRSRAKSGSGGTRSTGSTKDPLAAARNAPKSPNYSTDGVYSGNPFEPSAQDRLGAAQGKGTGQTWIGSSFVGRTGMPGAVGPTKGYPIGYPVPTPADPPDAPEYVSPFAGALKTLNAQAALAALTPDNADDIEVATQIRSIRGGELDLAKQSGDPDRIAEAATNFKSAIDAVDALTEATKENTKSLQDSLDALAAEVKRSTDYADQVQQTSNFQLTKMLADLVSGHIVGRGVAGRAFTPGSGVEVAY